MKFLKGAATFSRLKVAGPKVRQFSGEHLESLSERFIGCSRVSSPDGSDIGWGGGTHVFDAEFTSDKNAVGDALLFDLRVDTDKPPSELVAGYYAVELKALSRDNPSGTPSARQRREAKEIANDRVEQEGKDGRFKRRTRTPVLWDSVRGEVLFGSSNPLAIGRLTELFAATFPGHALAPLTAGSAAVLADPAAADAQLSAFVDDPADEAAWCPGGNLDFLGNEFLLWLWHTGRDNDTLDLADGSTATFFLSGGLKLDCPRHATGNDTINADAGTQTPEAREGLKTGKLPRLACLTVVRNGEQFAFKLNAETLSLTGAKLPKPPDGLKGRAADEHRVGQLRDLAETVDLMFGHFIAVRLSGEWAQELSEIRGWIARPALVRS